MLVLGSSVIRAPEILEPKPNTTISRTPVFKFRIIKNVFYKDYEVELRYSGSGGDIRKNVFEDDGIMVVTVPATLKRRSKVELVIKINKGINPITLWSKSFSYKVITTF